MWARLGHNLTPNSANALVRSGHTCPAQRPKFGKCRGQFGPRSLPKGRRHHKLKVRSTPFCIRVRISQRALVCSPMVRGPHCFWFLCSNAHAFASHNSDVTGRGPPRPGQLRLRRAPQNAGNETEFLRLPCGAVLCAVVPWHFCAARCLDLSAKRVVQAAFFEICLASAQALCLGVCDAPQDSFSGVLPRCVLPMHGQIKHAIALLVGFRVKMPGPSPPKRGLALAPRWYARLTQQDLRVAGCASNVRQPVVALARPAPYDSSRPACSHGSHPTQLGARPKATACDPSDRRVDGQRERDPGRFAWTSSPDLLNKLAKFRVVPHVHVEMRSQHAHTPSGCDPGHPDDVRDVVAGRLPMCISLVVEPWARRRSSSTMV